MGRSFFHGNSRRISGGCLSCRHRTWRRSLRHSHFRGDPACPRGDGELGLFVHPRKPMLVPSDVNQCGQDAAQDRQAKHCRSETGSELSACAERSLRPWHRDVEIRRRLRRQILTRHRLVAWPWFALGGGYIGGEFRPLESLGSKGVAAENSIPQKPDAGSVNSNSAKQPVGRCARFRITWATTSRLDSSLVKNRSCPGVTAAVKPITPPFSNTNTVAVDSLKSSRSPAPEALPARAPVTLTRISRATALTLGRGLVFSGMSACSLGSA